MNVSGNLRKMHTHADENGKVHYQLPIGESTIDMNALVGKGITLSFSGAINCTHCGAKTKKSFNQGYCYRCFSKLAQCDSCMIKPENCHYDQGTCREPSWGEDFCFSDHFVYLANTGNIKVGITRHVSEGISTRWMDQGATQATVMLRVSDRLTSGLVETLCKSHIGDKTNWRTMLKGEAANVDLLEVKQQLLEQIASGIEDLQHQRGLQSVTEVNGPIHAITYPVQRYPEKVTSINADKTPEFSGMLEGIKGQYLLFNENRVINIRKYAGYQVNLTVN